MKKTVAVAVAVAMTMISFVSSVFAGDSEDKLMTGFRGPKVDSSAHVKQVFGPGSNGKVSYGAGITVYPLRYQGENGIFSVGPGYKLNGQKGYDQRVSERHLARLAIEWENENHRLNVSALAGRQSDRGRNWKNQYDLVGGSFYYRWQDNKKVWFFKAEVWGQFLDVTGGETNAFIDIGGRIFIYNGKVLKPFVEANFSIGTPGKFASASIGIGVTDKNEIFYVQIGPYFNLRKGGAFGFADAGIDLNNLVLAIGKANAADEVTETPPAQPTTPVQQETKAPFVW